MRYLLLLFTTFFATACNNSSQAEEKATTTTTTKTSMAPPPGRQLESPMIEIEVGGIPAGTAFLIGYYTDQRYRADSASVDDSGRMAFQRDEPYQPGFYLVYLPNQSTFQLLIDQDQTMQLRTQASNLIGAMEVEGNLDNELLYQNLKFEAEQGPQFQAISQQMKGLDRSSPQYKALEEQRGQLFAERTAHLEALYSQGPASFFTQYKKAGQNPSLEETLQPDGTIDVPKYRRLLWETVDFTDSRLLHTPVIANKLKKYMTELTAQHQDSINQAASFLIDQVIDQPEYYQYFVNWVMLQYDATKTSLMDPQSVFVHMVQNYYTRERATWADSMEVYGLQQRAGEMAASVLGKKAPDVRAPGPDGRMYAIADIKAPYIVVYMYNPTCEHCMEQTPKLVRFYQEWKPRGVEVFGIALDTDDAEWKNYIAKTGMNWINVFDPSNRSIYGKYYVDITPEIYVINPNRTLIAKNLKVHQIEEVIRRDQAERQ